jgi:hypothetical protein
LTNSYQGKTPDGWEAGNGVTTMQWIESNWPPEFGSQAIGVTLPLILINGRLIETDVVFNGVNYSWSTTGGGGKMDVETIALHEFGHVFGLADLYDNTSCYTQNVVMCGYASGAQKRTLRTDDSNGICYLYPKGKYNKCSTDADCTSGQVCSAQYALSSDTIFQCIDKAGLAKPGQDCDDTYNFPDALGKAGECENLMCLQGGLCSKACASDGDCPYNMPCKDTAADVAGFGKIYFKGCAIPGKICAHDGECSSGETCRLIKVSEKLVTVCMKPAGSDDGSPCTKWDDCKSGVCYEDKCSDICGGGGGCAENWSCEGHQVTGEGGETGEWAICVNRPGQADGGSQTADGSQAADGGQGGDGSVPKDGGQGSADGSGGGGGGGVQPGECACDETYNCDPDCDCDPECQGANLNSTSGCACSAVGL